MVNVESQVTVMLLAMLVGLTGVVLLIVGLSQGKQRLWLPGAIAIFLALISGLWSISMLTMQATKVFKDEFVKEIGKSKLFENDYSYMDYSDDLDFFFERPVTMSIVNHEGNSYIVDVYPAATLTRNGIELKGMDSPHLETLGENIVRLRFTTSQAVDAIIELNAYDIDNNHIATARADIKGNQGQVQALDFSFGKDASFPLFKHLELMYIEKTRSE